MRFPQCCTKRPLCSHVAQQHLHVQGLLLNKFLNGHATLPVVLVLCLMPLVRSVSCCSVDSVEEEVAAELKQLMDEVWVLGSLSHPSITRFCALVLDPPMIVMQVRGCAEPPCCFWPRPVCNPHHVHDMVQAKPLAVAAAWHLWL